MIDLYKTICDNVSAEIEIKKSRFIASCYYVESEEQAASIIKDVKKTHYKANHNCSAYRLKGDYVLEKSSDDGEPSGTAGMPILACLRGEQLKNVLVIVTRYFGGTKLGTGGLVRAYSAATKAVLAEVDIVEVNYYSEVIIGLSYANFDKLNYYFTKQNIIAGEVVYGEDIKYSVFIQRSKVDEFIDSVNELLDGNVSIDKKDTVKGYLKKGKLVHM